MDVSKNRGGPPKWMVYNGKPLWTNGWFGGKTPIFGNTHMDCSQSLLQWLSHIKCTWPSLGCSVFMPKISTVIFIWLLITLPQTKIAPDNIWTTIEYVSFTQGILCSHSTRGRVTTKSCASSCNCRQAAASDEIPAIWVSSCVLSTHLV